MKTSSTMMEIKNARSAFIETLSNEFTSETGVGIYAYLAPMDINQLFKDYLQQSQTIKVFAKYCVKNILTDNPLVHT